MEYYEKFKMPPMTFMEHIKCIVAILFFPLLIVVIVIRFVLDMLTGRHKI